MSLRHLKKVFDSKNSLPGAHTSSEEEGSQPELPDAVEEVGIAAKKKKTKKVILNKFALLAENGDEDGDDDLVKSEDDDDSTEESTKQANRKKQKRKKKKKKTVNQSEVEVAQDEAQHQVSTEDPKPSSSSAGNIAAAAAELGKKSEQDQDVDLTWLFRYRKLEELFEIDPKLLNPEYELKKMFGTKVINNEKRNGGKFHNSNQNRRNLLYRRGRLVYPKERRSTFTGASGITMELLNDPNSAFKLFKFSHSTAYRDIQKQFLYAVNTLNPDTIVNLLRLYPYHIDAHIQLSDMAKHSEDMQIASELIEDGINYLQNIFHHQFDICSPTSQLPYKYQENRSFHILLFKYLVFLGQRGCPGTALQLCKKLVSLDPNSDPLGVTLMIDFYALKSGEYAWLCNLYEFWNEERNLIQLPNWAYSTALAYYMRRNEVVVPDQQQTLEGRSNELLQHALTMFPSVLLPLLDKCGIQSDSKVINHWYFNSSISKNQTKSLNLLCDLYVWRTHHIWRDPSILQWLEFNTQKVISQIDHDQTVTDSYTLKRQRRYAGTPYNILRHIILTDSKDITIPLPQELSKKPILSFDPITPQDGINIYHYTRREELSRPAGGPGNNGILRMLFRSLVFDLNAIQDNIPPQAGGNELGRVARVPMNNEVPNQNPLAAAAGEENAAGGSGLGGIQDSVTSLLHAMRDLLQTVNPVGTDNQPNSNSSESEEDENEN